jgi:hypothetical protein
MITVSDEQLSGQESVTSLDWAVIALLQRISHDVVRRKIEDWKAQVAQRSPDAESLSRNLAAGFLFTWWPYGSPMKSTVREELKAISEGKKRGSEVLLAMLEENGHLLFNSYYYVLTQAFGDDSLVPVVPGRVISSLPQMQNIDRFITRSCLPFHLNQGYLSTYSTLVLPLRGGLTPNFCELYERGQEGKILQVPLFLGDLSILLKREDYVHRHLSALICALDDCADEKISSRRCVGAYVLTSSVPYGFNEEDSIRLRGVIEKAWEAAPLRSLHDNLRRASRGIQSCISSPILSDRDSQAVWGTIFPPLHKALAHEVNHGGIALRINFYDDTEAVVHAAALNFEGISRALRSIFPSGPWLNPSLVSPHGGQGESPIIELSELLRLCRSLDEATSLSSNPNVSKAASWLLSEKSLLRSIRDIILPDLPQRVPAASEALLPLSDVVTGFLINNKNGNDRILIIRAPDAGQLTTQEKALCATIRRLARHISESPRLPGSVDRSFAGIQERWNSNRIFEPGNQQQLPAEQVRAKIRTLCSEVRKLGKRASVHVDVEILAEYLYSALDTLVCETRGTRAVLLLSDRFTFIPRPALGEGSLECLPELEKFWEIYRSYPCFWLFESINHYFTLSDFPLEELMTTDMPSPQRFWLPASRVGEPSAHVFLSKDETVNMQWMGALTYLGVPVHCWDEEGECCRCSGLDAPTISVHVGRASILDVYREYLQYIFRDARKIECLRRVFAHEENDLRVLSVEFHPILDDLKREVECIRHVLKVQTKGGDGVEGEVELAYDWLPIRTVDMSLGIFNTRGILESNLAALRNDFGFGKTFGPQKDVHDRRSMTASQLRGGSGWIDIDESGSDISQLEEVWEALVNLHDSAIGMEGEAWQGVVHVVTHEIGNTLPGIEGLIAVARRESSMVSLEAAASRCERSVHFLRLIAAAYGTKSINGDMLGGEYASAEEGSRILITVASDLGVGLARKRSSLGMSNSWFEFLRPIVQDSFMPSLKGASFWTCNSRLGVERRLGAQVAIVSAVANAVQHLVHYIIAKSQRGSTDARGTVDPPCDFTLKDTIKIILTQKELVVRNRAMKGPFEDGEPARDFGRIGSIAVLRNCIDKDRFQWERGGSIEALGWIESEGDDAGLFELRAKLPQPFWEVG